MSGGYDIETRMAEVAGKPQRIAPIPEDQMDEEMHALCRKLRVAFGIPETGLIPELMRTMFVHAGLFKVQMDMGFELAGRGALPVREREIAVLRVAWLSGAPYEWGEHVDQGKRAGITQEEIERIKTGSSASGWSEHDRAILKGVEELRADSMITDETWETLAKT